MFGDDIRRATLRRFLKDSRIQAGLRQEDVAQRLGKPQSYVAKIESGERKIDMVEALDYCAVTGAEPSVLIKKLTKTRTAL